MMQLLGQNRVTQAACLLGIFAASMAWGQTTPGTSPATTAATAVSHNSSYIEPNGTAHVSRIVPVPQSLSPQAQASLRHVATDADVPESLGKAARRDGRVYRTRGEAVAEDLSRNGRQ